MSNVPLTIRYDEVPLDPSYLAMMALQGFDTSTLKSYQTNTGAKILVSVDPTIHGRLLHVSISRPSRYPDWDEIKAAKEHFFGDRTAIMVFPRKELYVNQHKNCFHLWELPKIPGPTGDWEVN